MQLVINNSLSDVEKAHSWFNKIAEQKSLNQMIISKVCIALDEVLSNVINHGYQDQKQHQIVLACSITKDSLSISIKDDGIEFNPLLIESPDVQDPQFQNSPGGLGIHLMKNLVDEISYQRVGNYNLLTLLKNVK